MSPKKAEASPATPAAPSITLSNLRPAKGATKDALRVGRGRASGAGKTCNRGHNGEGQRSGRSSKVGFEGGQMPAYRRLPKLRTFYMHKRREWLELNVGELDALVPPEETELSYVLLAELFLLTPKHSGVRLLGNGEIKRKLTIHVDYASPAAQDKLKAAGCTLILPEEAAE